MEHCNPDEAIEIALKAGAQGISLGLAKTLQAERDTLKTANEGLMENLAMLSNALDGARYELLQYSEKEESNTTRTAKKALIATEADVKAWLVKRDEEKDKEIKFLTGGKGYWRAQLLELSKTGRKMTATFKAALEEKEKELAELKKMAPEGSFAERSRRKWRDRAEKAEEALAKLKSERDFHAKRGDEFREELESKDRVLHEENTEAMERAKKAEDTLAKRDQEAMMLKLLGVPVIENAKALISPEPENDRWFYSADNLIKALSSTAHLGQRLDAMLLRAELKAVNKIMDESKKRVEWYNKEAKVNWNPNYQGLTAHSSMLSWIEKLAVALTEKAEALESGEKTK